MQQADGGDAFVGVSRFNHRRLMAFVNYCSSSIVWATLVFLFTMAFLIYAVAIPTSYALARWAFGLILFNTFLYVLHEKVRLFGRGLDSR